MGNGIKTSDRKKIKTGYGHTLAEGMEIENDLFRASAGAEV